MRDKREKANPNHHEIKRGLHRHPPSPRQLVAICKHVEDQSFNKITLAKPLDNHGDEVLHLAQNVFIIDKSFIKMFNKGLMI